MDVIQILFINEADDLFVCLQSSATADDKKENSSRRKCNE